MCLYETRNLYRWKSVGFRCPVMIMISITFLNEEGLLPAVAHHLLSILFHISFSKLAESPVRIFQC